MLRLTVAVVCCLAVFCQSALADAKSPVNQKVENFTLSDFRGAERSLSEFQDSQAVVIVFLGTECPLVKLYAPRLAELAKEYEAKGVTFLGVNSNRQDSITEIAAYARIHEIPFPILKDTGNKVADQLGAKRTPEVFVLDQDRVVQYWGRIDDQYGVGYVKNEVTRRDLAVALDELLAGKPVSTPVNAAVGCYIGRIREPKSNAKVTYSNQIARVFQQQCVECHREGEIAPFAMTSYDEVAGWADTIAEVVREQRMPPWHADAQYGKFANDCSLSDSDKQLIYDWVTDGAPEGDKSELPEPIEYTAGWQLPQPPDAKFPMSEKPFAVPAEGEVKYQYFTVETNFDEDKWIKAAEVIPGNRAVVHHVLIFVRPPGASERRGDGEGLGFLAAYVPGLRPKPLPEGYAKRLPKGSRLVFQVHYTPIGSAQEDKSVLGLVFAKPEEVTHLVHTVEAIDQGFEIPPQDPNYRVEATSSDYNFDVELVSMSPHMHLRGKAFSYEAVYPDGQREMLLDVPRYDFNWQTTYRLAELKTLPKGTKLHCVAHFDNSENNYANPDPAKKVTWGDQTWEEMMIGFFDVAVPVDPRNLTPENEPDFRPSTKAIAQHLLSRFDQDGDGLVKREEVPLKALVFFALIDLDKNGELTLDETIEAIKKEREKGGAGSRRKRRD